MKTICVFSHKLTELQETDLVKQGSEKIVYMPDDILSIWKEVPPSPPVLSSLLEPIVSWLEKTASKGNWIIVQGDYGATYILIQHCFRLGLVPIYSTTSRNVIVTGKGSTIKSERTIRHEIFRKYEVIGS